MSLGGAVKSLEVDGLRGPSEAFSRAGSKISSRSARRRVRRVVAALPLMHQRPLEEPTSAPLQSIGNSKTHSWCAQAGIGRRRPGCHPWFRSQAQKLRGHEPDRLDSPSALGGTGRGRVEVAEADLFGE